MIEQIAYQIDPDVSPSDVADLYRSAGLNRPVEDLDRIARMIAGANLIVSARLGGRLVGIARALTDFSYCCYLSDLAVHADFQRRGIGQELIRRVRTLCGDESMLLLLAAPAAMPYYPLVGFSKVENGWTIARER